MQSEKMAALGGLVAGVAHEINTPVGIGVTAASYLHQRTLELNQMYADGSMETLRPGKLSQNGTGIHGNDFRQSARAADQVQGFKQVAVAQTNDEKRYFKLKTYIDGVLFSLSPRLKRTKHLVSVNCPEDLAFTSYPGAFSQIITNFVMNSLIHANLNTSPMGRLSWIFSRSRILLLCYRDNGRGMTEEERLKISEPFYTTKRCSGAARV